MGYSPFSTGFLLDFVYQYLMSERNDVSFCELRDFERSSISSTKTLRPRLKAKPQLSDVGQYFSFGCEKKAS